MLEQIIIISLICVSAHQLTRDDQMFSFWQKVVNDKDQEMRSILFEPVSECLFCMASFWTCLDIFLTDNVKFEIYLLFLACFLFLVLLDIFLRKKRSESLKYLYLILVFLYLSQSSSLITSLTVMFSVSGLNFVISKILSFDDNFIT